MNKYLILIAIILLCCNVTGQSKDNKIVIVKKFYYDTLETNYRKVKLELNRKAVRMKRMEYYTNHSSDTNFIYNTTEYIYRNGGYISISDQNFSPERANESCINGDTIISKQTSYGAITEKTPIIKKVYSKNKIIYAARYFPKRLSIPNNELKYIYNEKGKLIEIKEKYIPDSLEIEYKTIFEYSGGILSRITEFKKFEDNWRKEYIREYDLLTEFKLKRRVIKRINTLLLDHKFMHAPW